MVIHLRNVSLSLFRSFLEYKGLKVIRTSGGHEIWSRSDLGRPVVLQTHISPVPEFIVKQTLRHIGSTRQDFEYFVNKQ
jgi:predicted RNA binding protein YcfA (HicA-like mRNA interferase family)